MDDHHQRKLAIQSGREAGHSRYGATTLVHTASFEAWPRRNETEGSWSLRLTPTEPDPHRIRDAVVMPVAIVAEHASARFGGEAALPLHYFRVLQKRGWPVWLVCHARVRDELLTLYPHARDRMLFIEDTWLHRLMWRLGRLMPARIAYFSTGFISRMVTQRAQRQVVRDLIRRHGIRVVHQPMPVSPKEPSMIHGLGVPVVIGPMNGGMDFPPAFQDKQGAAERLLSAWGRASSSLMNRLVPGKLRAAMLLVANDRTRRALPDCLAGPVQQVVENGVDLSLWTLGDVRRVTEEAPLRLVFMGRLVGWKAVDLLLHAFARASSSAPMTLEILGDGPEGSTLRNLAATLGVLGDEPGMDGKVYFCGWQPQAHCAAQLQAADALVLPSLMECGGAVVLEAMACGRAVIATAWGGPLDYLDDSCGILVKPSGRDDLIEGLAQAMIRLSREPDLRHRLGQAARRRVEVEFDWEAKVDQVVGIYASAIKRDPTG